MAAYRCPRSKVWEKGRWGTVTAVSGVNGWCSVGQKGTCNKGQKRYSSIRTANVSTGVNHWGL